MTLFCSSLVLEYSILVLLYSAADTFLLAVGTGVLDADPFLLVVGTGVLKLGTVVLDADPFLLSVGAFVLSADPFLLAVGAGVFASDTACKLEQWVCYGIGQFRIGDYGRSLK